MLQDCDKPVAGKKLKRRVSVAPVEDTNVPYDSTDRWTGMNSNLTSMDAPSQYQRLKLIQNTVRVDASSYSMNRGALNVYETRPDNIATVGWNQMSDRTQPHVQAAHMSMKSSVSIRPGNMSPGGIGCDIKHNSYDRYLARLKAAGPLRKDNLPLTYGLPIKFNPNNPIYGGKTVKTSIGTSLCACGPLIGPFIRLFSYTFDIVTPGITKQPLMMVDNKPSGPSKASGVINDYKNYIPIISNNELVYISTVTVKNTSVTVDIQYLFKDDGSTTDGFSFNISGLVNFYNTYTRNLKIITFGNMPLSRGGSQFKGFNKLPTFPDDPSDILKILGSTSLSNCFAEVINFNGLNDTIMTILNTDLIIDTSYMFSDSAFNIEDFTLDITYIDDLTGMFQNTSEFNPSNLYMNVRKLPSEPVLYQYEKSTAPKPLPAAKKIVKGLFSKAKALTANPRFIYFNANASILGFSRMQQTQEGASSVSPAIPEIMEDISSMFYECPNLNPVGEFSLIAAPVNMDYTFFNAPKFNAQLDTSYNKLDMRFTETMDYAFSGAASFLQPLTSWDLQSLISSVNVFSGSPIPINVIPNYFAFEYTFVYEGSFPINILDYLPLIKSETGALQINPPSVTETPTYAPDGTTIIKMEYLINFNYLFADDGTTLDGLTFINVVDFYNTNVPTGITINRFGGLHLSRGGSQFAGITVPLTFVIQIVPRIPSILPNTLLNNCFYNTPNFNSDIHYWITTNVTDMTSMFENASAFSQDLSSWDVNNVVYYENFADNSGPLTPPIFVSRAGLIYSFTYTGTDDTVNYENYIPIIINDNSFAITSTKITTTLAKLVTVQIEFTFSDDGVTSNGLSFINVTDFYNLSTTGLTDLVDFIYREVDRNLLG